MNNEQKRLDEARNTAAPWRKWGPYLSERQWGYMREDYSESGDAWDYFSHNQARSRAYHWGENGLAGISDDRQRLCFALALWNGKNPILKERLFRLTNSESNQGEDVKGYYFYLGSTPTYSYLKYLYKYPQAARLYDDLVQTNHGRSRQEVEYELINTGVFDEERYFDVFVEYAKELPEDLPAQISIHNRGPEPAELHVLPTLWFRNRWFWGRDNPRPTLQTIAGRAGVRANEVDLGDRYLCCDSQAALLSTSTATTVPGWLQAARQGGPELSLALCICSPPPPPIRCSNSAKWPQSLRRRNGPRGDNPRAGHAAPNGNGENAADP